MAECLAPRSKDLKSPRAEAGREIPCEGEGTDPIHCLAGKELAPAPGRLPGAEGCGAGPAGALKELQRGEGASVLSRPSLLGLAFPGKCCS